MARPKICLTRKWPSACEARLVADYEVTLNRDDRQMGEGEIAEAMRTHDAVCPTVTDPIGARVFDGATARILGNYGVGVNHIDLDAARAAGIVVANTPDCLTEATADIAITLMLMVARRAGEGEREVRREAWTGWRPTHLVGPGLRGRTLGIVGMGRIGQEVARVAQAAFGMQVLYWNRSAVDGPWERVADLGFLMERADVVSLHLPGGAETDGLIGMDELVALGPDGILVNTARGTVVDEAALIAALRQEKIAGAGLDVYAREPDVPGLLRQREDVVLLPHLGSATKGAREAMGMMVADALDAFFAGREVETRVA